MSKLDPNLQNFFRSILHQAIHSGIRSIFFRMPLMWSIILIAALIGAAVYFKLY
jgi:hypothetical protein